MSFHLYRSALLTIVFGCLLPVFALTEVTLTNGTVSRGTIVSEEQDFIILNVDGNDITIYRSMIQSIKNDEIQNKTGFAKGEAASDMTVSDEPQPASAPQQSVAALPPLEPDGASVPEQGITKPRIGRDVREKVSIGLNLGFTTSSGVFINNTSDVTSDTSRSSYTLNPYVGFRRSDILELRPSLLFRLNRYTNSTTYEGSSSGSSGSSGSDRSYKSSNIMIGCDFGVIFYPVRGNFFRLSVGPTLGYGMQFAPRMETKTGSTTTESEYDKYVNITIPLNVPFSFDFIVSEHLGLRLSSQIYSFSLNINRMKPSSSSTDYTSVSTSNELDLSKVLTELSLGVFLLF